MTTELDALDTYDLSDPTPADYEDTTPGDVRESIETNMWLAESFFAQGAEHLARECATASWKEYSRWEQMIDCYAGRNLGDRLRAFLLAHFPDVMEAGQ